MTSDIISIGAGVIVDYSGTPLQPLPDPSPILPGLTFSCKGKGQVPIQPGVMPYLRGSYRVSFTMATPPLGFYHVIFGCGMIVNPTTTWGYAVVVFDSGAIVALDVSSMVTWNYLASTTGPVPDGTPVTLTTTWDSTQPINGAYYANVRLEGSPVGMTMVTGTAAWDALARQALTVGGALLADPAAVDFPGAIGRIQFSNTVLSL